MARKATLGTIANFMSQKTKKQLEKEKTVSWADLFSIRPDPGQPRRLLPTDLAERFSNNQLGPRDLMDEWLKSPSDTLTELQTLAGSIAQHGLINPISVRQPKPEEDAPSGVEYLIVTGERRWWAHVLLVTENRSIHEGETTRKADEIKITLTAEGVSVRAHQLIENLMREDLGAIEKAQGMWALRYELSNVNPDSPDPEQKLVTWKKVEESLAISGRYRRFITSVMNLSPEVQALIQKHHLSEYAVRPITRLREHPELQLQALQQLLTWQKEGSDDRSLNKSLNNLVDALLAPTIPFDSASADLMPTDAQLATPSALTTDGELATPPDEEGRSILSPTDEEVASPSALTTDEEVASPSALATDEEVASPSNDLMPTDEEVASPSNLERRSILSPSAGLGDLVTESHEEEAQGEPIAPPQSVAPEKKPSIPTIGEPAPVQNRLLDEPKANINEPAGAPIEPPFDTQARSVHRKRKKPQTTQLQSHAKHLLVLLNQINPEDIEMLDELRVVNGLVLAIQSRLNILLENSTPSTYTA